jgi:hypothetical protein
MTKTTDSVPTRDQLRWAGRVWDSLLARDCRAIAVAAFNSDAMADALQNASWEFIGSYNQGELAEAMLRLQLQFKRGSRP